jgi:nucleoside-diphosphate-sugar epimerase
MSIPPHVVLGGGAVGSTIAEQLVAAGEAVRLVTRSGRASVAGAEPAAADLTDPAAVRAVAAGAEVAYFACQPAYTDWPAGFPPLAAGVLGGLAESGTRLAVVDNLYMYGPTGGRPITEDLPYAATGRKGRARAALAEQLLGAHRAGDVPVVIARASDYFGPLGVTSVAGDRFFPALLAGKKVQVFGDPSLPHSYTFVQDFARTLIELGRRPEAFGQAWHVPTAAAVSQARFAQLAAEAAGVRLAGLSRVSKPMLRLAGLFVPAAREMIEMAYEFEQPYILDSSKIEQAFGLRATPLEDALAATVRWWRDDLATGRRMTDDGIPARAQRTVS